MDGHHRGRLREDEAMTALPDFLLARFAEDEALARTWLSPDFVSPDRELWRAKGQRDLADCQAKRAIVALMVEEWPQWHGDENDAARMCMSVMEVARAVQADRTLGLLALPYASHPEYREVWRP